MKVFEVTFEIDQRVQAQIALAAETEEDARAGVLELLSKKNPEIEITKVRDMTEETVSDMPASIN